MRLRHARRTRRVGVRDALGTCVLVSLLCGCYYGHLAVGQTRLLWARRGVDAVLADPSTTPELRRKLELVGEARRFGERLGLDVGRQYTSFVDWQGDRVVTTVVATRPGEVEPAGFRFPIVGTLPYKGFFDEARAQAEAESLESRGFDVCVSPITAYSTLGWLPDPLTAPMLRGASSAGALVETVLHELVHASVFVPGDGDFNEGLAQAFAEEAVIRFAAERPKELAGESEAAAQPAPVDASAVVARERARIADRRRLLREILAFRERVAELYAREEDVQLRSKQRAVLEDAARRRLAVLPLETRDAAQTAEWVRLGDACLAIRGTYAGDAPLHAAKLASLGGDLRAYLAAAREAADQDDPRAAFFGALSPTPTD